MSIPPFLRPPAGVTAHTLTTDRGTFAVLDNRSALDEPRGSAVLVPGFTGSKEDFIAVLAPLAARGVHALALDLAGQFESTRPDDTVFSLGGFAADVWSVAHRLAGPRVLVGHSFGGLVVREAVLSDPLSAQGLVIVASGPAALPDDQQRVLRMFAQVLQHQGLAAVWQAKQALEGSAGAKQALEGSAGATPAPADVEAFLTARFVAHSPASLLAMIEVLTDVEDQVDALASVAPSSVVVVGGRDDAWPVAEQRAMAGRLGARLVELPQAGHSPAVDDPEATADAIASLLP